MWILFKFTIKKWLPENCSYKPYAFQNDFL